MKKLFAILTALCMLLSAAALAEAPAFTLRNGITFGLNMDQIMSAEPTRYHEIDTEHTRGITFDTLEYENVTENGARADLTYFFVGNELVALRVEHEARDISYDALKTLLTNTYGESAPVDLTKLGNGVYAVDDDGRLEARAEAWISGQVMIVLEQDEDDLAVTYVDLSAVYVTAE